jgi:hypothetical protein
MRVERRAILCRPLSIATTVDHSRMLESYALEYACTCGVLGIDAGVLSLLFGRA